MCIRSLLVLLSIPLSACGGASEAVDHAPPSVVETIDFWPARCADAGSRGIEHGSKVRQPMRRFGAAASHYGGAAIADDSGDRDPLTPALFRAVRLRARRDGFRVPVPSARWGRVARELAQVVCTDAPLNRAYLQQLMWRHGIVDPVPPVSFAWGPMLPRSALARTMARGLAAHLADTALPIMGIGSARRDTAGNGVLAVLLPRSYVRLEAIPRALPRGGTIVVEGELASARWQPRLRVSHPGGRVDTIDVHSSGPHLRAEVPCPDEPGAVHVELALDRSGGRGVLASFPVWCGVEPSQEAVPVARFEHGSR